jgi:hypothetical protein
MLCQSDEDGFETMSMLLDQAVILQRVSLHPSFLLPTTRIAEVATCGSLSCLGPYARDFMIGTLRTTLYPWHFVPVILSSPLDAQHFGFAPFFSILAR